MMAWLLVAGAWAHPLAPAGIDVDVVSGTEATLTWRTPTARPIGVVLTPRIDGPCEVGPPEPVPAAVGWAAQRQALQCQSLDEATVTVEGLVLAPVDVVLTVRDPGGITRRLLTSDVPKLPVIGGTTPWTAFFGLGVEHLITGPDHLLLVIGLTLLLGVTRKLAGAITAFTVGHSLTLAVVALGGRGPVAVIEIAIAASLVWLALELLAEDESPSRGWLVRYPAVLSLGVGLLHGAGFGGALADLGLPRGEVVPALLAFNVGIEVAQLGVVALLVGIAAALPWFRDQPRTVPAYFIGAVSMAWVIERVVAAL